MQGEGKGDNEESSGIILIMNIAVSFNRSIANNIVAIIVITCICTISTGVFRWGLGGTFTNEN